VWTEKSVCRPCFPVFSTVHSTYYYHYRLNENYQEAGEEELCVSEPNVTISPMSSHGQAEL
jgi:hypothetical protein